MIHLNLHRRSVRSRRGGAMMLGVAGAWLLGGACSLCPAQEGATSGTTPPRGAVRIDSDPLRQRSATENVVFGRIVDSDEHRLILREGEDGASTEYRLTRELRVYLKDHPAKLSDIPAHARVRVVRDAKDGTLVTDLVVLDDEVPVDTKSPAGLGLTLKGEPEGLMVTGVRPNGPADKAGIKTGDEIVSLNDELVARPAELTTAAAAMEPGAIVTLRVRRDGVVRDISLALEREPAATDAVRTDDAATTTVEHKGSPSDATLSFTPPVDLGATLGTTTEGIEVVRIQKGSPLADSGVREGDLIQKAAGQNVLTPESLFRVLNEFDGGAGVELTVVRSGTEREFTLQLPESHTRVLIDPKPATATTISPDARRRSLGRIGNRDQLEQAILAQQQQIQYLANELQALRRELNLPAAAGYPGGFGLALSIGGGGFVGFGVGGGLRGIDTDGDGIADAFDVNGDGQPDRLIDINGDGIADGVDADGDGVIDEGGSFGTGAGNEDVDGNGIPEGNGGVRPPPPRVTVPGPVVNDPPPRFLGREGGNAPRTPQGANPSQGAAPEAGANPRR